MEALKTIIPQLAARLSLTISDEQEPYILTPEEEASVIEHEIIQQKKHKTLLMRRLGMQEGDILQKLSEIDFSALIDREAILRRANISKNYDLWQKGQRQAEKEAAIKKLEELRATWTYKRVYQLMAWTSKNVYGKELVMNTKNKPLIMALCFFVSDDPRFETELGYTFKKGLMIRGISGIGKTHLVKCIADNGLYPIHVLSMIEIAHTVKADGEYRLDPKERKIIYLDDVGTEEAEVKHYGTTINWYKDFIETYYLKTKPFRNLIISTNNNGSELETKYGFRARSRMREMFNVIDVTGKDMRS